MSAAMAAPALAARALSSPFTTGDAHVGRRAFVDLAACVATGARAEQTARAHAGAALTDARGAGAQALIMGTAAHALDFDDYEPLGATHPTAVIGPALIALGLRRGVDLGATLAAYGAGYETVGIVGRALGYGHYMRGWHATSTIAGLGAAAGGAWLLGLDEAGIATSISLAMTMAAGLKAQFGSDAKALHAGFAARAGVEAAALAAAGASATMGAGDGPIGYLSLYGAETSPGWEAALEDPRPTLAAGPPWFKPWPACAYAHRAIEAAERLAARPGFTAEAVERAEIAIPEPYLAVAGFTEPQNPHEARFSVRYCVAAALHDGRVGPESFARPSLERATLRALIARVALAPYPLPPGLGDMSPEAPDTVRLTRRDGRTEEETVRSPHGGPENPLSDAELIEKHRLCGGARGDAEALLSAPLETPLCELGAIAQMARAARGGATSG